MKNRQTPTALLMILLLGLTLSTPAFAMFDKELDNEKLVMNFYGEVKRGNYQVIDTAGLKKLIDEKKPMLMVDTMPLLDSYKKQHIPGAVQFEFPIPEVTEMTAAQREEFKKLLGPDLDRVLVIYCGFPKCTRSHNGAMWAVKLGYKNVFRYPGGIKAWMEAGYQIDKAD